MNSKTGPHSHTNRLSQEKSPYLLQHQHNPVDWMPWGPEAFEKARKEGKPILLSIGYSTCHWCHVMERESFEDADTAAVLNTNFISIKVDREERPDVDKIYMTFVQAMTGSGGWPMNVFLTPELKPFFGGTYWPPERKYGRPGFRDVLGNVAKAWAEKRKDIEASAEQFHDQLGALLKRDALDGTQLAEKDLHAAGAELKEGYDSKHGGFGRAPKFPIPSHLLSLLRHGVRFKDREAVEMVLTTCRKMARGGICDQLGGGFARYSVDERWLVPHFEKMLYDNAQLLHLYLDAFLVSKEPVFAQVARDILGYVQRDMTHAEGGFYSAEDADSEGKEGKFYCWTLAELKSLLTKEELEAATRHFGLTEKGNFHDHSDPDPLPNLNVLSQVEDKPDDKEAPRIKSAREKMMKARGQRVRPHLDDKVLSSWNGLMLGATARAGVILKDPAWLAMAEKNASFLKAKLWDSKEKVLYHRWRDGARDASRLLDSNAFLLWGLVELYQATLDPSHLEFAVQVAESMLTLFYDPREGGFWQSAETSKDLILRVKEDSDGAEPSGNAVATLALLKLSAMTDRSDFREAADRTLRLFSPKLRQHPQHMAFFLTALDFALEPPQRVVLAGSRHDAKALLEASHSVYEPRRVQLGTEGLVEPFARTLKPVEGQVAAYVCLGSMCKAPVRTVPALLELLGSPKPHEP